MRRSWLGNHEKSFVVVLVEADLMHCQMAHVLLKRDWASETLDLEGCGVNPVSSDLQIIRNTEYHHKEDRVYVPTGHPAVVFLLKVDESISEIHVVAASYQANEICQATEFVWRKKHILSMARKAEKSDLVSNPSMIPSNKLAKKFAIPYGPSLWVGCIVWVLDVVDQVWLFFGKSRLVSKNAVQPALVPTPGFGEISLEKLRP